MTFHKKRGRNLMRLASWCFCLFLFYIWLEILIDRLGNSPENAESDAIKWVCHSLGHTGENRGLV